MSDSTGTRRGLLNRDLLRRPLVYDGSKGVYLSPRMPDVGHAPSDVTEWLNVLAPEAVLQVHGEYIEAGSQIIQTNTFNGNRLRLEAGGLGDRVREVNLAGARLAREAAGDEVLVAGVVGPSGKLVAMGDVDPEALTDGFAEQAAALAEGGADLFHVETMTDMSEARAAVEGLRRASDLPVILTMSFDTGQPESLRTMMGVSPAELTATADEMGLFGVGANCGRGLEGYRESVEALALPRPKGVLVAKFNAGIPRMEGDRIVYDGSPERMADYARWCAENGVGIVGGCCGTTPRHIRAMSQAIHG